MFSRFIYDYNGMKNVFEYKNIDFYYKNKILLQSQPITSFISFCKVTINCH